jgi:hypothetical protein
MKLCGIVDVRHKNLQLQILKIYTHTFYKQSKHYSGGTQLTERPGVVTNFIQGKQIKQNK